MRKNFPTRSKAPKCKFDKGKTKAENVKNEMNKTWKKKAHLMEKGSLHSMSQVVTLNQTKKKKGMWD